PAQPKTKKPRTRKATPSQALYPLAPSRSIPHACSVQQITLSEGVDIVDRFEQILTGLGLTFQRLALKKYPSCVHWHIQKLGLRGTLEATFIPEGQRLWVEARLGRQADWQPEAA